MSKIAPYYIGQVYVCGDFYGDVYLDGLKNATSLYCPIRVLYCQAEEYITTPVKDWSFVDWGMYCGVFVAKVVKGKRTVYLLNDHPKQEEGWLGISVFSKSEKHLEEFTGDLEVSGVIEQNKKMDGKND